MYRPLIEDYGLAAAELEAAHAPEHETFSYIKWLTPGARKIPTLTYWEWVATKVTEAVMTDMLA